MKQVLRMAGLAACVLLWPAPEAEAVPPWCDQVCSPTASCSAICAVGAGPPWMTCGEYGDCRPCEPTGCAGRCGIVTDCNNTINCGPCMACDNDGICEEGENATDCPNDNCNVGPCHPRLCMAGECGMQDDGCGTGGQINCGPCCSPYTPTFTMVPSQPEMGQSVTFQADPSLILDPPAPWWDLGNGTHLSGNPLVYTYTAPGTYDVRLTASDARCEETVVTDPVPLVVASPCWWTEDPTLCCGNNRCDPGDPIFCPADCPANPGFSVGTNGPRYGEPMQPIELSAQVTTNPGENVLSYEWRFGDGTVASGPTVSHAYAEPGLYVVKLVVRTNFDQATATTTATINTDPGQGACDLECEVCCHQEDFRWNPVTRRLEARARLSQDASGNTEEYRVQEPVVLAVIYDPTNRIAFGSGNAGYRQNMDVVDVDFSRFHDSGPARFPIRGLWRMRVTYYYHHIYDDPPTLIQLGPPIEIEQYIDGLCNGGLCDITGPKAVDDGRSAGLTLRNPLPGVNYTWDWELGWVTEGPPGNGPPNPRISPATGPSTTVRPKWVAVPNQRCVSDQVFVRQALVYSQYEFSVRSGTTESESSHGVAVQIPWGLVPEKSVRIETPHGRQWVIASTSGVGVAWNFRDVICRDGFCWVNPTIANYERTPGRIDYGPGLENSPSPFFPKSRAHEEEHQRFQMDPQKCGSRYFTERDLQLHILACTEIPAPQGCKVAIVNGNEAAARSEARARAEYVSVEWSQAEAAAFMRDAYYLSEKEAWAVGDQVPPNYLWETCNADEAIQNAPPCPR
jgi:PKD repeat protein